MRNLVLLLAGAALTLIAVVACRARNDSGADTTGEDTGRAGGSVRDSLADARDTMPGDANAPPTAPPARRGAVTPRDSAIPPADSIRAMRPKLPGVVPDSKPGRWRGLKLPETRPVRPPIESIRAIEQVPDSVMKGDSTRPRPPQPDR
jgi:hypothetical protein